MIGFSRGAVTVFATAKKLDSLNIPMNIIANQPVPGDTGITKRLYSKYCDLSACKNIKSACTFWASHNLEQGFLHNYFYQQMVAQFDGNLNEKEIIFPHQNHIDGLRSQLIRCSIGLKMQELKLSSKVRDFIDRHQLF